MNIFNEEQMQSVIYFVTRKVFSVNFYTFYLMSELFFTYSHAGYQYLRVLEHIKRCYLN